MITPTRDFRPLVPFAVGEAASKMLMRRGLPIQRAQLGSCAASHQQREIKTSTQFYSPSAEYCYGRVDWFRF